MQPVQQLESWPTDSLIEYARNPRKNDHAVDRVAAAIREFGFRVPILAKSDKTIVDGHLRLKAAKKLGLEEVPVLLCDDMTDIQVRAFRLSVNKVSEFADWDDEMLRVELDALGVDGFDLELTGFSLDEIADLQIKEVPEGLTDEDAVPEAPGEPLTVLGDVWLLGRHRLMCDDSTSIDAVDRLMDGQKADMVFTDPPYGINEKGDRSGRNTGLAKNHNFADFKDDTTQYAIDAYNLCEGLKIPRQVWWGANYYCHALPQSNNWFIWDKRVEKKMHDTQSDCEMAWVKSEFSSVRIFRHLWKGFNKDSERGEARVHPTQKPVELAIWAFDYFKNVVSVLDFFGGSGSALIACEKTNRKCYMMELSPVYCDVIINRWQQYTGKEAVLESTGETYNSKMTV
jgi:DNA modification methylase